MQRNVKKNDYEEVLSKKEKKHINRLPFDAKQHSHTEKKKKTPDGLDTINY